MKSIFGQINQMPAISKEELERRLSLSVACVIDDNNNLREAGKVHPSKSAYTWVEKTGPIIGRLFSPRDVYKEIGKDNFKVVAAEVGEFITLHEFGHPLMFKPSMKEVLSQLPAMLFDEEKLGGRKLYYNTTAFSDHAPSILLNQDYQVARTKVWHDIK